MNVDYRYDPSWRQRKRDQMARLVIWTIAAVIITGELMVAVWMASMGSPP